MTTTTAVNDVENSLPPSLFNIQYPNCRRGMFSLREPFKNMNSDILPTEKRQASTRKLTPAAVQPTYLNIDQVPPNEEQPVEPIQPRQKSKRNAEVQCSLLTSNVRHDMAIQTKIDRIRTPVYQFYDENDITPRSHRHRKLQPIEQHQKVYEIWDIESPPLRAIPVNQTIRRREILQARHVRNRKPIIEYPDEEVIESDYNDERIVYPRQPRKTIKKSYLPPNVRMICVRNDANRVSY